MTEHGSVAFAHALVRIEKRTMVESTCRECGSSKLVLYTDGSLAEWEQQHSTQHRLQGFKSIPA